MPTAPFGSDVVVIASGGLVLDVMVIVADPVTDPEAAWIVLVPGPTPLAEPVLLIVATDVLEELHVAVLLRFWVLPSL